MPNYVPYLLLSIASICTTVTLLVRTKSPYTVILSVSLSGMIYFFEYVVLVVLNAYRYNVQLLDNPTLDSMIGAIVSNLFAVPTAAVVQVMLKLRLWWIFIFALIFTGIEWLFVHLGIFEHHWWRLHYTTAGISILLLIAVHLDRKIRQGSRFAQFFLLAAFSFCLVSSLEFALLLAGVRHYISGVFADSNQDDIIVYVPYALLKSLLLSSVIFWTGKRKWFGVAVSLIVILLSTLLLIRFKLLVPYIPEWQFILLYMACCLLSVSIIYGSTHWIRGHLSRRVDNLP